MFSFHNLKTHLSDKDGGGARAEARAPASHSSGPSVWPRYDYSKGKADMARMMTPFFASNVFGSIRSNSMTNRCPSLNVQGH